MCPTSSSFPSCLADDSSSGKGCWLNTVVLSRLNSEMMLSPDLSDSGKNLARKTRMRPQKTVFWLRLSRRRRSGKKKGRAD